MIRCSRVPVIYPLVATLSRATSQTQQYGYFLFFCLAWWHFTVSPPATQPWMIFYAFKTAPSMPLMNLVCQLKVILDQWFWRMLGILTQAQAAWQHFGHMLNKTPYLEKTSHEAKLYVIAPAQQFEGSHTVAGRQVYFTVQLCLVC